MGDNDNELQELKTLVAQQARYTANLIAEMVRTRGAPSGPVHVLVPDADAALVVAGANKISKLGMSLRISYKVKEFKDTNEGSVKEWLTKFDQEILTQENVWYC